MQLQTTEAKHSLRVLCANNREYDRGMGELLLGKMHCICTQRNIINCDSRPCLIHIQCYTYRGTCTEVHVHVYMNHEVYMFLNER